MRTRWLADENFNNDILRALLRRAPSLDIVRVQDVGLTGLDDPAVLDWAAKQSRIILTHDVTTLTMYAYDRVTAGLGMPGVFEVSKSVPIAGAVDDILLLWECTEGEEWFGQVWYLPLR